MWPRYSRRPQQAFTAGPRAASSIGPIGRANNKTYIPAIMNIAAWPHQERPRERLFANGCASLTDAELLAIVLRTGVRGASALELARNLLAQHGGLRGVLGAVGKRGTRCRGVGPGKVAQLNAG